jgi:CubicO group peptidase (beta-lactamase class C family)
MPLNDHDQNNLSSNTVARDRALAGAVEFSQAHEIAWDRDPAGDGSNWGIHNQDRPPWNRLLGPVHARGPLSGVIRQHGQELVSWGEPNRADLTFSVAKTYLALLTGLAVDRGLITDIHQPVGRQVKGIGFEDSHNASVTWAQMLQQTSEWQGQCWGVPDQVDHFRKLQFQPTAPAGEKGDLRMLQAPGSYWEYNDVRINQLSLALLHVFGRPIPEVFREAITEPIGASRDWRWVGYDNSWIELNGQRVQSVPGGTHWGGGLSISARDQSLIGQLLINRGAWNGKQLISPAWIDAMRAPCAIAPWYGFLVWLNQQKTVFPSLPTSAYAAFGAGGAITCVLPEQDAVVVVRWLDATFADAFLSQTLAALS